MSVTSYHVADDAKLHFHHMKPKIFVTYHKDTHLVSRGILEPIQVGVGPDLPGCSTRDNTGSNIAHLNDRYCEMTAAYWAWKNVSDASHIGLMHYRRLFDFNDNHLPLDQWGVATWPAFTTDFEDRFGLDDISILAAIKGFDMVLPRKWSVRNAGCRDLREHYIRAPYHYESDLKACRNIISDRSPEYLPYWRKVLAGHRGWFNNMFVLRADIFHDYCAWLFPLLAAVEQNIPLERYGVQEKRVMGYLSERLLNVWLLHYLDHNDDVRIRELDRVFVTNPSPKVWDPVITHRHNKVISVVIASDDMYVPHLGALLASIFDNICADARLDLLILDGGIRPENKTMLKRMTPNTASLHFVPMSDEFLSHFTHMHFSRATFYRLILDNILETRDKVIYVDCDTIVLGDLGELWDIDMEDKPIAAVHDYIMEHFCNSNVLSADFTGSLPARRYLVEYVGIPPEHCHKYFQAGLLIMNLRKIRELALSERMVETLLNRKYWFLDQDVLNKYFSDSYLSLPAEWNLVNSSDDISKSLNPSRAKELHDAQRSPKLIHYAGYEAKPWVNRTANLGQYYFFYLRRTFWYEQVLGLCLDERATIRTPGLLFRSTQALRRTLRRMWRRLPWPVRRMLNPLAYSLRSRLAGG